MTPFNGLIAAPFTPMHPDGSLNLDLVPALVDKLMADGLRGAFVCGSNGEGPNLTTDERMAVAEAFVQAAGGRLQIWVHVGHSSIRESQRLIRHAREVGADAASAVAAFYFKPTSAENLVDCMAGIAGAAPDLPFYYYHIPALTGVGMDMRQFLELSRTRIPSLRGLKYTAPTLQEYQACLEFAGSDFDVLYGTDEMLLPALAVGAQGAIGSTYNFAGPLYLEVMENFREGRLTEARAGMAYLIEVVRALLKFPPIPAQKAIMHMLGWDLGPGRLPLGPLSNEHYGQLQAELEQLGFFKRISRREVVAG